MQFTERYAAVKKVLLLAVSVKLDQLNGQLISQCDTLV